MPKAPTTQLQVLEYCERTGQLITSSDIAQRLGISKPQAVRTLRELADKKELVSFYLNGGSVYITPKSLKRSDADWTTVLSQISYLGLRSNEFLRNPRSLKPDVKLTYLKRLKEITALVEYLTSDSSEG